MDCRSDKVDMLLNLLWDAVLCASNMGLTSLGMNICMVFRLKKVFGFLDGNFSMQPIKTLRLPNAVRADSRLCQPVEDRRHGFIGRCKRLGNLLRCPVISKVRRFWVRNIHQELVRLIEVGLSECDSQR